MYMTTTLHVCLNNQFTTHAGNDKVDLYGGEGDMELFVPGNMHSYLPNWKDSQTDIIIIDNLFSSPL